MTNPIFNDASLYQDVQNLDKIKSNTDQTTGLKQAADQFEVQFLQMVLKNMREANSALSDGSDPTASDQQQFYQEMYDDQLASSLVKTDSIGLSDTIVAQLGGKLKSKG
jgi:flagellar protein FlgJ